MEARQRVSWVHRRLVNIETASHGARREVLTALRRVVRADVALEYRAVETPSGWRASGDCTLHGSLWRADVGDFAHVFEGGAR